MKSRHLIYISSSLVFLSTVVLFIFGIFFVFTAIILNIKNENGLAFLVALPIMVLPILTCGIGLIAAWLLTRDFANNSISNPTLKRGGIIAGFFAELLAFNLIDVPHIEPFLMYWLPPLLGGVLLIILSYTIKGSKLN